MNMLKKATVALAATSLVAAPVAASAAPQTLRADTAVADGALTQAEGGATVWILGLLGLGLFIFGAIELFDGGDDSPTSP